MLTAPEPPAIPLSMLRYLFLSIGQLGDRAVLAVLAKSLALTLALFAVLGAGLWWLIQALTGKWLGDGAAPFVGFLVILVVIASMWLLFRAVAVASVGLFADEIVVAVERKHYAAALERARSLPFHQAASLAVRSAVRVIAVNLLLLPIYVMLLLFGVGTGIAFLLVNGWLLGRDLGDMVAVRHLDGKGVKRSRGETAGQRFLLGLGATVLLTIPIVNLVAPLLGAAMATHLFHARRS
ncbi:EI24 domain-containing protein [Sphingomonas sp. KR1UV-12]|uniref:EI24 domain-containing protein n=1 Tax=Sphingomonas aurea TaxID=3063994 RepID=A0ABT9EKK6_9SPHN|nr:EI24 domain-containing protein [Sphingomonas sp. KR1UV-12]MDP1027495.1 EI24 domain-containing protein [Sphingomonas sp. KR1UV-12]